MAKRQRDEEHEDLDSSRRQRRLDANAVTRRPPSKDSEDSEGVPPPSLQPKSESESKKRLALPGSQCPYLDTIARQRLDFDFEKCCSVSLLKENVYVCLVCGKYFQGRGPKTHACTHALEEQHSMFMNLKSGKVYCLPDGYEVIDRSLEDIKQVLNPRFTEEQVKRIDEEGTAWRRSLDGQHFLPGMVGLNNIKCTDYANVVVHSLLRVKPFRNFFLRLGSEGSEGGRATTLLLEKFGELCRKMWNPGNFKGQVSPLEFLLAVQERSKRRFRVDVQSDPVDFLTWLLNTLHFDLTSGKPSKRKSIVTRCFQGEITVTKINEAGEDQPAVTTKFLMLGLDLPPTPLFKDAFEKNIIPQVPLFVLLKKYNGTTISESIKSGRSKYSVTRLPDHLIVWAKRFTKNNFFREKNPTIVTFPVKSLDVADNIPLPAAEAARSKYDLVATGCHVGKPESGSYHAILYHFADQEWYQVEDLSVKEVRPEIVAIQEAYFQIYSKQAKFSNVN
ncbi:ubiquitin-specific protease domain-containing protein [Chloropicon primus]|uniref:Ubiquitin-specific protease domain-containing protein n=1 Tax=Chloropicon primus TaxID=1764295 RepID=A0A5B8MUS8_9CHLO|nr:ubiquitin-specific protease domain-containing protein [Chloropicon primus]UPR03766.1 ubiquitin-specific protease domain-containing protein [Chloropicon primus]|eukprot:QDZ24558.1 ubiquitin-specific protease domain-containing protein [Chloropicon primus]